MRYRRKESGTPAFAGVTEVVLDLDVAVEADWPASQCWETLAKRGLEKHFLKLPQNIKGKQVNDLDRKLKAIGGASLPVPKGPMPRGKVPRR